MRLEELLSEMERVAEQRFLPSEERHRILADMSVLLAEHGDAPLRQESLAALDRLALRAKRHALRSSASPERDAYLARVEAIRTQYHGPQADTAYRILAAPRTRYERRFRELEAYLETSRCGHDELFLALDYLQTNRYLRRRARRDSSFARRKAQLERSVAQELAAASRNARRACRQPHAPLLDRYFGTSAYAYRALAVVGAGALALAALPVAFFAGAA